MKKMNKNMKERRNKGEVYAGMRARGTIKSFIDPITCSIK